MFPKLLGQAGLAMTRFISGHPEALEDLERVAADLSLFENHVGAANADYLLGTSLHQLGELERASAHLHQAVDFYRRSQMCPSLARTLRSLADLMESQGRAAEAQACRAEAESFRSLSGKTQ
jgi:tetratricopeptide (TPR) repeat protein